MFYKVWHMHNIDSLAMKGDVARMRHAAPFTDALSHVMQTTFVGVAPNSARMVMVIRVASCEEFM